MSLADTTDENFVRCIYHSDLGKAYTVRLKKYRQVAGGFVEGEGADGRLPQGMKMRYLNLLTTTVPIRRETLPCHQPNAAPYSTTANVLPDGVECKITGRVGEKSSL